MPEINHCETALGGGIVAPRFAASTAPGIAQRLGDDHGDDVALARGLLRESADGLRLVSELVADQKLRVRLTRHVEELADLSEAWSAVASANPS